MANILVAEDDEFLREIIKETLVEKGHEVTAVADGKMARDLALDGKFELILSDVQMPFLNGVELLKWLRQRSNVPFVLMTGFTNLVEAQKASDLGADGFLSKPFKHEELTSLIASLTSKGT